MPTMIKHADGYELIPASDLHVVVDMAVRTAIAEYHQHIRTEGVACTQCGYWSRMREECGADIADAAEVCRPAYSDKNRIALWALDIITDTWGVDIDPVSTHITAMIEAAYARLVYPHHTPTNSALMDDSQPAEHVGARSRRYPIQYDTDADPRHQYGLIRVQHEADAIGVEGANAYDDVRVTVESERSAVVEVRCGERSLQGVCEPSAVPSHVAYMSSMLRGVMSQHFNLR